MVMKTFFLCEYMKKRCNVEDTEMLIKHSDFITYLG